MRYKSNMINKILCCAVTYLTILALLIVARAQTDVVTNTILSFENEVTQKEITVATGAAKLDLPPTLRTVIALAEESSEAPEILPAKLPQKLQDSSLFPADAEEPPNDAGKDSAVSEEADKVLASSSEAQASIEEVPLEENPSSTNSGEAVWEPEEKGGVYAGDESSEEEGLSEHPAEVSESTEAEPSTLAALSVQTKAGDMFSYGTLSADARFTPQEAERKPDFVPAEPDNLYGYEAFGNNIYTYTDALEEIEYRTYGSFKGRKLAWFACDEAGNVFGVLQDVPVHWVCDDYDEDTPGTYRFTAEFDGYDYDGEPVVAMVTLIAGKPAPANSIGGKLWLDKNADGIMDSNEAGVADYPVHLYAADNMDTLVQTTHTKENGTYRFEHLQPGSYVVGIAAEFIGETEYLMPVIGVSGDNKFALIELAEETMIACSEPIVMETDAKTVENLHAGVRLIAIQLRSEVIVSDAKSFIEAVNNNTTWNITLASDIVIEYGMTNGLGLWNTNYQSPGVPGYAGHPQGILVGNKTNAGGNGSFVIDGQNEYKIIFKWPHTIVEGGNFQFLYSNYVTSFTMKNLTWYGSSEVGCYFPAGNTTRDVQITFDSVTYKGPGMGDIAIFPTYNPQVLFRDCNIIMSYRNGSGGSGVDADGYGGSLPATGAAANGAFWQDTHSSEITAANFITFEGENTIYKQDSPADGDVDPIFYIYWGGDSYINIADGASLMVYDEAGKTKPPVYTTGFIGTHHDAKPLLTVGESAVLEYHHIVGGNGFINDFNQLGSLILEENASVVFDIKADTKFSISDAGGFTSYFRLDSIHVGRGASWTYVADYAGSAARANSSMICANSIDVSENASVNIIAKNNSEAETLITLRDSSPSILFDCPKNIVLFNDKSNANTYVIKSSLNASLIIKTNTIRSWLQEQNATMTGSIVPGNQAPLNGNYMVSPNPNYQWMLHDTQYSATLNSGTDAAITNYTSGFDDIFNLSGTHTLKNINILELRAPVLPVTFLFQKENESNQALPGVKFDLYPQDNAGTGWDASRAILATSDAGGQVIFTGLNTGKYLLAEEETVMGYQLPTGQWEVIVDAIAGRIDIVEVPDGNGRYPPSFTSKNGMYKLANYRLQEVGITVTKIVSGDYTDLTRPFVFTIRFQNADGTPFSDGTTLSYTGGSITDSGATAKTAGMLTLDINGEGTFTLTHGQTITFQTIATNSLVQVIEEINSNYEPSFLDSEKENATSSADTGLCILTDNRTFSFTNTRLAVIPTGISAGKTIVLVPLALLLLLLAGALII